MLGLGFKLEGLEVRFRIYGASQELSFRRWSSGAGEAWLSKASMTQLMFFGCIC